MIERHKTMQRRVDGGGTRIEVEGAMRQEADHAIFVFHALVDTLQRFEFVHVKGRKTIKLDGANVTARPLHPHDTDFFAGQRVGFQHLGGRIAAAIIGNTLVTPQQVGAVQKLAGLIKLCGVSIIPAIFEKADLARHVFLPSVSFANQTRPASRWVQISLNQNRNVNQKRS
ncbi:hypothetical protein D3C80_1477980 [compost metagenome]